MDDRVLLLASAAIPALANAYEAKATVDVFTDPVLDREYRAALGGTSFTRARQKANLSEWESLNNAKVGGIIPGHNQQRLQEYANMFIDLAGAQGKFLHESLQTDLENVLSDWEADSGRADDDAYWSAEIGYVIEGMRMSIFSLSGFSGAKLSDAAKGYLRSKGIEWPN